MAWRETVVTCYKNPNSYTGEDLVEISCHGNPVIVDKIIRSACDLGARIAEPGEFTRRAFINGKLDLVQAEAVAGLIHAQSTHSSRANLHLLKGELSQKLIDLRQRIIQLLAGIEFELDISEDDLDPELVPRSVGIIETLISEVSYLLSTYYQGKLLNSGARIVIAGKPNVGKSTLMNALVQSERAIVSTTPGTTRDTIDATIIIDGVPLTLVDTAGLRDTGEEIELEGVRRTRDQIATADLVLVLFEPTDKLSTDSLNLPGPTKIIPIINKFDTVPPSRRSGLAAGDDVLMISAINKAGIDQVRATIKSTLKLSVPDSAEILLTTNRQHRALTDCKRALSSAVQHLQAAQVPFELVAVDLRDGLSAIDRLLGQTTADDILQHVFNKFCVGK